MDTKHAEKRLNEERQRLLGVRRALDAENPENATQQESASELSSLDQHPGDQGSETFESEKQASIAESVDAGLADIERAFERLENGRYGTCEVCGKAIGEERLEALPATRLCIDDAERRDADSRA